MKSQQSQGDKRPFGFILSLELIMLLTILGIGLVVGLASVRDAVFKKSLSKQDQDFYVLDSRAPTAVVIGQVVAFDEFETPLVPFVDYDVPLDVTVDPPTTANYRVLLGVRSDRFTSRQPAYYSGNNCTGDVCIAGAGNQVDARAPSYMTELQGQAYAIGGNDDSVKGRLYRRTATACSATALLSKWESWHAAAGSACVSFSSGGINTSATGAAFFDAVSVDHDSANVLDPLTAPFYLNTVGKPSSGFTSTEPDGEG